MTPQRLRKMARQKKPKPRTDEELREIIFQCVGAASGVWMRDEPGWVFPATETIEAVESILKEFDVR